MHPFARRVYVQTLAVWRQSTPYRDRIAVVTSHPWARFAARIPLRILFWCTPPYLLYLYYSHIWQTQYWDRGGQWTQDGAFPEYRVTFVILCWCVPIWAAFMAGAMLAWQAVKYGAAVFARRVGVSGHLQGFTAAYQRLQPMELESIHSDDETTVEREDQPLVANGLANGHAANGHANSSAKEASWPSSTKPPRPGARWWTLLCFYLAWALFGLYAYATFENKRDFRFRGEIDLAVAKPRPQGYGKGEKIFLAAMFHQNEPVLPFWIEQMNRVIQWVGTDNIYISILESYSTDNSPLILEQWDKELERKGVKRQILTNFNEIKRPDKMLTDIHRMEFLSATRNRVLAPLKTMPDFDRMLFSNDIFIHAESVVELLNTRNGDYDVVCGMDFAQWGLYDNWVVRDAYGQFVSSLWPHLIEKTGWVAMERDEPAPVFACWNGIFLTRASPFMTRETRLKSNTTKEGAFKMSEEPLHWMPKTHPMYPEYNSVAPSDLPALEFRLSGDDECFSSESFLIPYDLRRMYGMEKHFMHPMVVNTYLYDHYLVWKYIYRNWLVQWWIKKVEQGFNMFRTVVVVGHRETVYSWDGGLCHGMPFRRSMSRRSELKSIWR
ncbi:cryptococcal mannosyltransferase 1-domain-containing protein [Auriculariales sp. MPI-PUGE-AT-0066]|nr:cryptococcal mannosyltransferase 1-domain-containing protein [Auriculariales sp. MPI-PUGE-AT-0066]